MGVVDEIVTKNRTLVLEYQSTLNDLREAVNKAHSTRIESKAFYDLHSSSVSSEKNQTVNYFNVSSHEVVKGDEIHSQPTLTNQANESISQSLFMLETSISNTAKKLEEALSPERSFSSETQNHDQIRKSPSRSPPSRPLTKPTDPSPLHQVSMQLMYVDPMAKYERLRAWASLRPGQPQADPSPSEVLSSSSSRAAPAFAPNPPTTAAAAATATSVEKIVVEVGMKDAQLDTSASFPATAVNTSLEALADIQANRSYAMANVVREKAERLAEHTAADSIRNTKLVHILSAVYKAQHSPSNGSAPLKISSPHARGRTSSTTPAIRTPSLIKLSSSDSIPVQASSSVSSPVVNAPSGSSIQASTSTSEEERSALARSLESMQSVMANVSAAHLPGTKKAKEIIPNDIPKTVKPVIQIPVVASGSSVFVKPAVTAVPVVPVESKTIDEEPLKISAPQPTISKRLTTKEDVELAAESSGTPLPAAPPPPGKFLRTGTSRSKALSKKNVQS
jgi:hypothetical protein